jgi:hypothetical protein
MFLQKTKTKYFFGENDPPIRFIHIMQEYDSKCLKMYLITLKLKVFKICPNVFAPITKVNEGASSTYSAFHNRSPTRAVTGPVEIHVFSMWN